MVAILFATLILAVSAKDLLMWSSYKINQAFIEKTICINRDRPEVMCHGKCYLTKKIVEDKGENKSTIPIPAPDDMKQLVYFQTIFQAEFNSFLKAKHKTLFQTSTFTGQSCLVDIFQPPRAYSFS